MDLTTFDPTQIPFQYEFLYDVEHQYSKNKKLQEILLSGAIGSSKTTLMAAYCLMYAFRYPGCLIMLGRRSLPDLKATIFDAVVNMIPMAMIEGQDYFLRMPSGQITFKNRSKIISRSWADGRFTRFRSLEIDMAVVEELTENEEADFFLELCGRIGRRPGYPPMVLCGTNPDEPSHWVYDHWIRKEAEDRHTYYSETMDNPFLPKEYLQSQQDRMSERQAMRYLKGLWIHLAEKSIYYAYGRHNDVDSAYEIDETLSIVVTHDFNIGKGKPMSAAIGQLDRDGVWHWFDELVYEGYRTEDILEEMTTRDWWGKCQLVICGDATGDKNSTNSRWSDWDIVRKFLANRYQKRGYRMAVRKSNPAIRTRHNLVNAKLKAASGAVRMKFYQKCKIAKEGMALTAFKKGSDTIEDDSKKWQHITTAIGYAVCALDNIKDSQRSRTIDL